ncbi:hypothetical protein [Noviherbaspirillum sp.]|nr:hypothetical protein [Noviherbaspirillum sp.]HJV83395.1 hypothetical protein [Noviherbaspirillum sp.]
MNMFQNNNPTSMTPFPFPTLHTMLRVQGQAMFEKCRKVKQQGKLSMTPC